ncbi:MAG: GNAT family N-acetyltransferase [Thiomicrorhabdus sp.]|nr:GNAT family N-acetyltransferase [Thiomicrorhabdus sp.]
MIRLHNEYNELMSSLDSIRKQLKLQHFRQLVILSGSEVWQKNQLATLFTNSEKVFWVSAQPPSQSDAQSTIPHPFTHLGYHYIEAKRLPYHLGQEISAAVLPVKQGLSADTLGILAGMIQAGGLLVLLTPDVDTWQDLVNPENSRFLNTPLTVEQAKTGFTQHLIQSWRQSDIIWLEEHSPNAIESNLGSGGVKHTLSLPTDDQQSAIKAIHNVAFGHRKRPLVITADRGRGKSAVLGLAAVECLLEGKRQIAITANRLEQVSTAFKHATLSLEALVQDGLELEIVTLKPGLVEFHYQNELKKIQFNAPDALILNPSSADLLLIDEAAHLPTPVLTELLMRHHRLVFSTTLHGYEGSGRGFELRFKKQLKLHTPDWKSCVLKQPIRWAENDPLEKAINKALLLDADMVLVDNKKLENLNAEKLLYQQIDSQQLIENPTLLRALFGLFVQAHYQTSPNDLQQLLNAPNIKIITASRTEQDTEILGAILCIEEGKISPSMSRAHGHLVPQLLTKHYAQKDFLMLSTFRIMRIAVHPKCQRSGIGKQLIQQLEDTAIANRIDYISSSFGSSDELLPFWFAQHFWPLHVGAKRDKASGSHNIVVAKPLTPMARQALSLIQTRFQEQFPHLLLESLPHLPASQVWLIIQTFRFKKRNPGNAKALANYQNGSRPYESISHKLWEWSLQCAAKVQQASTIEQAIWCDKILKKQSWLDVAHQHHLAGRKGVEEKLKGCIEQWISSPTMPFKRRL